MSNISPKVSVIIPNYKHAQYLPIRIESVLKQRYTDFEVLLLDDCSPDNSLEVITKYAAEDARIRVILNEKNSGSTFKQWNKGFSLARGQYIWIAESDDYAAPDLLEKLVSKLDADRSIGLAYCDSWQVNERDEIIGDYSSFYRELDSSLWQSDFVVKGEVLLKRFMSYRNIIPNASAVLLRKEVLDEVGPAFETFKVNGDWLYWSSIFNVTKVAFVTERLNYFRQHTNNVRTAVSENGVALLEAIQLIKYISEITHPEKQMFDKSINVLADKWINSFFLNSTPITRHVSIFKKFISLDNSFLLKYAIYNKNIFIGKISNSKFRQFFRPKKY